MTGKVSASVQNAKPRLSVTLVDAVVESDRVLAKADISKITPVITRSQVIPTAAVAYTIPAADIAYINLFLDVLIDTSGLYRYTTESVVLTDGSVISFTKSPTESVSLADTFFREMSLGKSDSVSLADTLQALLIFVREFEETISLSDSVLVIRILSRAFADSATPSDSGYLFSQGYCDLTYFAEDYIGEYRTFN